MKRKCPICKEEKELRIGISEIGLVCYDCGMKDLKKQKEALEYISNLL